VGFKQPVGCEFCGYHSLAVAEETILLLYYATSNSKFLPAFRNTFLFPSSARHQFRPRPSRYLQRDSKYVKLNGFIFKRVFVLPQF
jgi:hypothetical protein